MRPELEAIKEKMEERVQEMMGLLFCALEECVEEIDRREQEVAFREQDLEEALVEVEAMLQDLVATDPDFSYETAPTYQSGGETYVLPEQLTHRDQHILLTLQNVASQDAEGRWVVTGFTNKDLVRVGSTQFDPLTTGGVSAALTRLSRQGLVNTRALSGRGYPRHILLKARLEKTCGD